MGGDGPPRGGTRGGQDQFNWEDVKTDANREFYIGASVKASVGRWQKGKDILWWTKNGKGGEGSAAEELAAVKAEEDRLMQEALGLRPATQRRGGTALDAAELKELLKRGAGVDGTEEGGKPEEGSVAEAMRIKGVGYSKLAAEGAASGRPATGEAWGARERLEGSGWEGGAERGGAGAAVPATVGSRGRHDSEGSESESGEERQARKRAKKEAKRARKEKKRERREERKRSHSRSCSASRSPPRRRERSRSADERRHGERERGGRDRSSERYRSRSRERRR